MLDTLDTEDHPVTLRIAAMAAAVCAASWLGLFIGAGNVGLQRSVSIGPLTLLEHPMAVALATSSAAVVAFGSALRLPSPASGLGLLAAVLVGDVIGAFVIAPLATGELTPLHGPVVFAALTVIGLQPMAAVGGVAAAAVFRHMSG